MTLLSELGIAITEAEEAETGVEEGRPEAASAAAAPRPGADDIGLPGDPVGMYLREMGRTTLLTREDEVALAKCIEAGRQTMLDGLRRIVAVLHRVPIQTLHRELLGRELVRPRFVHRVRRRGRCFCGRGRQPEIGAAARQRTVNRRFLAPARRRQHRLPHLAEHRPRPSTATVSAFAADATSVPAEGSTLARPRPIDRIAPASRIDDTNGFSRLASRAITRTPRARATARSTSASGSVSNSMSCSLDSRASTGSRKLRPSTVTP